MRTDHTLDLSVAMATPPIRPHPARWLTARTTRTNESSETTRLPRHTKRNETTQYYTARDETRRNYTRRKRKKVANSWVSTRALPRKGGFSLYPCARVYVRVRLWGTSWAHASYVRRADADGKTIGVHPSSWVAPGGSMPPPQLCSCRLSERPEKVYWDAIGEGRLRQMPQMTPTYGIPNVVGEQMP